MLDSFENCGYIPVDAKNLEQYYYDWDGNLYYKDTDILEKDGLFHIVDGFDLEDLRQALTNKVEVVFIYGEPLLPFKEEDILDV